MGLRRPARLGPRRRFGVGPGGMPKRRMGAAVRARSTGAPRSVGLGNAKSTSGWVEAGWLEELFE